ncbi:MAG: filamentous hemagglutinin N-terminal domain-containing protein [Planctomycetota bacterium]|nr:filamentous hemagglutinin N-terminal domain-containing protein [Planctomycetota bacterium]
MAHNGSKNTSSRPGTFRSATELAFAANRCMAGAILGVGRIGGWSLALSGLLVASLTQGALAGPEGAQVVRGDVSISRNGAETLIRAGRNSIINYRNFDIGANETVRFQQPDAASRVLNRVYSAQPTRIDGSLIANGRVYIVNPAGVLFSATARVDTNGLYAAAGRMSDSDFLKGINRFTDMSGRVVNDGIITSDFVGLLGKSVGNSGQIIAPGGTIVMAAGESVMVGERTGNVFVKVTGNADDVSKAAVDNTGSLDARRGSVTMAAGDVYSMAMRVGGSIKGRNVRAQAKSGEVHVTGTIDASTGQGGGAGEQGKGGRVEVLGEKVGLFDATINASGTSGGGDVRVGGDVQGKGDLQRAQYAYMSKDSTINVDATGKGQGGTAVIWSDQISRVYGDISARGGAQGGDGGFIETSAKGYVDIESDVITAGAVRGKAGNWLIDPRTVTITAAGGDDGSVVSGVFSPNADNANLKRQTIETSLNSNTSITVTTADATGAQAGDINVNATITKSGGGGAATLTLRAANDINVSSAITASSGTLNVVLQANNDPGDLNVNAGNVNITANINTNGGTFSSSGVDFANSGSGTITATGGATINHTGTIGFGAATSAGAGTLALTGTGISQTAAITAGTLTLSGTGTTTLNSANSISAISGSRTGAISVTTSTALAVGASGLSSGGNNISLTSGNLSIGGAVNAGAGDITLSTGSITQTAAINGDDLGITATGAVTLNGANSVTTLSGSTTTGAFAFTNSGLLTVGASGITGSGSNVSLTSTSGGVALNGDVTDTGTVALSGSTLSQTAGNTIIAGTLTLSGTGTATLNEANTVTNISGTRTGAIAFTNSGDLTVAAAGLSSGGSNITLASNALHVNGALNAGAGAATFTSAGVVDQTAAITAASLSITNNAAVTLTSANQVGTLSVVLAAGANVSFTNGIALAIGASGIDSQGGNIALNTGALTIGGAINAGAGDLDITAAGATQTAAIIGNDLILGGTGTFVLTNTSNAFDTVTGALTGAVSLFDNSPLTVGGLGLSTSNAGALSIESSSLTLNANASAGAANNVTLTTDALAFGGSGAVTGLNITVRNQSAGTSIGVGDGAAGAFAVPTATLTTNFNSTGLVTFGRSDASVSGAIDVAAGLDLSGETFGLSLAGGNASGISLHGLTLATNKNLTINSVGTVSNDTGSVNLGGTGILSITSTGAVTQLAAFITPNLVLNGAGPFTLDSVSNVVASLSGSPTGGVELVSTGNLSIGALSMGANTLDLTVNTGTVTQTGAIAAASLRLAGSGTFTLTNPSNDIDTLASSATGIVSLTEVDGFAVGTVVDSGIASSGANVTLNSTGGITISRAIALSGGNLSLTSGGATTQSASISANALTLGGLGSFNLNDSANNVASVGGTVTGNIDLQVDAGSVTQTGALTAAGLALRGAGVYVLTTGTNDVDTIASSATGDVQFTDTDGLTVGTVGIAGITSSGADVRLSASGPVAISSAINLGAGNLGLSTSGAVTQTAAITAAGLRLTGSGTFTLNNNSNTLTTLAAGTTGVIQVTNSQTLDVGTVLGSTGISSGGQNVTLTTTAGSITLGQNVNVGAGTLALNGAAGGSQTGSITAGTLTLAGGGYTLLNASNAVGTLSGTFNGTLQYRDTDGLTVGALNSTSNPITINLPSGAMSITGAVNGSTVSLTAQGISESGAGAVTATSLTLAGTGTFNLSGSNAVGSLQGTVTGPVTFVNTTGLGIGGTLSSGGSNIALTTPALTVSNAINAGAGTVSIITNTPRSTRA